MKRFKTFEELMDYVSNKENLEFLESGEVLLKEWNEDAKVLRQYQKRYGLATSDQKVRDSQTEALSQRVAEMAGKLDAAYNELAGIKAINYGDDKEMLQRLNAEIVAVKAENRRLEKQVATIPDLQKKIDEWNCSRILEAAKKAAACYRVPQNIIDDPDFESIVVSDLDIDDIGNVFVKEDYLRNAHDYIVAKQRVRPHWQPKSKDSFDDNGRIPADQVAIAGLYSQTESSKKYTPPIDRDDRMSDEQAAIAALFG